MSKRWTLDALIAYLETFPHVVVIDGVYEGRGLFTLKIQTARHVYLDTGPAADWIALIRQDAHTAQQPLRCPFCSTVLDPKPNVLISCPACHAVGWIIDGLPHDVASQIFGRFFTALSPAQALMAWSDVETWLISAETPDGAQTLWVWPAALHDIAPYAGWPDAMAPNGKSNLTTQRLPLLISGDCVDIEDTTVLAELNDPEKFFCSVRDSRHPSREYPGPYRWPTCHTCRYRVAVSHSQYVGADDYYCGYPKTQIVALVHDVAPMIRDKRWGGTSVEETQDILLNRLLNAALAGFLRITEDQHEGYEPTTQTFFGPVCPNYVPDPEELELRDEHLLPLVIPITFGVVNWPRAHQQDMIRQANDACQRALQRLTALQQDAQAGPILRQRITRENIRSAEGQTLKSLLQSTIDPAALYSPHVGNLKQFLNISHAAWDDMLRELRHPPCTRPQSDFAEW